MALADWKRQSLHLWNNMEKKQKYIIIGSAVLLFVAILGWSYWMGSRPDMVPLYTDMDMKDAGEVREKLKEMKVNHEIGGNGTSILVPSKDVYRIRLDLASIGLPRGNKGFEIFDQNKFGTTEFQNKVYYLQALQGELTKTIEQMAEVEKARVHIVMPEDSLYKKNEKPATASIMLKLRPRTQLTKEQVKGIVNLVGHSIQGLKPENITVVDNFSRILNDPNDGKELSGTITMTQIEMTKKVQDDLQKRVQSLLDEVLGMGKSVARVNVELSFDQRTLDRQVFEPVVEDKGIVRSVQELSENFKGTSPNPGGPPGTTSNIPGYVTSNNSQSNYEKKEVIRNYEINETKEKVIAAPGTIKRLTVAVLIDANFSKAQQDSITKAISSAAGINSARGDAVSVESIPFSTELADKQRQEEQDIANQKKQQMYIVLGVLAAILAAIGAVIVSRVRRKRLEERERQEQAELEALNAAQFQEAADKEHELSEQDQEIAEQRASIEKLARSNPEDMAQLIKAWLADD